MFDKQPHTWTQVIEFVSELSNQTDRGAAIVAGAVLEDQLERVIHKRIVDIDSKIHKGLFGRMRFAAKVDIGLALGLYDDKLYRMLTLIRDIRNEFAHTMESITFDHPAIVSIVNQAKLENLPDGSRPKHVFMICFATIMSLLYLEEKSDIRLKPVGDAQQDEGARQLLASVADRKAT